MMFPKRPSQQRFTHCEVTQGNIALNFLTPDVYKNVIQNLNKPTAKAAGLFSMYDLVMDTRS